MAVFVDAGAPFAYFVCRDPDRAPAVQWMKQNRQPLLTTDRHRLDRCLAEAESGGTDIRTIYQRSRDRGNSDHSTFPKTVRQVT
jgi:hypothetical protein